MSDKQRAKLEGQELDPLARLEEAPEGLISHDVWTRQFISMPPPPPPRREYCIIRFRPRRNSRSLKLWNRFHN